MALDPARGRLVLCACGFAASQSQLWEWGGTAWVSLTSGPLPATGGMEVTDADRGVLLLFGAPNAANQAGHTPVDVWVLTARSSWAQLGRIG